MKRLIKSPISIAAIGLGCLFWALNPFIPERAAAEVLAACRFSFSATLAMFFLFPVWQAAGTGRYPTHEDRLSLGLFIIFTSLSASSAWAIIGRAMGDDVSSVGSSLTRFFMWGGLMGSLLCISAPREMPVLHVNPRARATISIIVGLGLGLALFLLGVALNWADIT